MPGLAMADISGPFFTTTPVEFTLTDWINTLSLPQFDPSLGHLDSVQIDLTASMLTILTVTNYSPTGSSGSSKTHLTLAFEDSGDYLKSPTIDMLSGTFAYTLGGGQNLTSGTLTKTSGFSNIYTSPAVLSQFTGLGVVSLTATAATETYLSNVGGNTTANQDTRASTSAAVTYKYTSTPEPATLALLAAGFLGILRRRRH
jgi:hypothetical protein